MRASRMGFSKVLGTAVFLDCQRSSILSEVVNCKIEKYCTNLFARK